MLPDCKQRQHREKNQHRRRQTRQIPTRKTPREERQRQRPGNASERNIARRQKNRRPQRKRRQRRIRRHRRHGAQRRGNSLAALEAQKNREHMACHHRHDQHRFAEPPRRSRDPAFRNPDSKHQDRQKAFQKIQRETELSRVRPHHARHIGRPDVARTLPADVVSVHSADQIAERHRSDQVAAEDDRRIKANLRKSHAFSPFFACTSGKSGIQYYPEIVILQAEV